MSEHTPGPWRLEGRRIMALKERPICDVPPRGLMQYAADEANARLIAAAPDLLAACKATVAADEDAMAALAEMNFPTSPELTEITNILRAAIQKAEGDAK